MIRREEVESNETKIYKFVNKSCQCENIKVNKTFVRKDIKYIIKVNTDVYIVDLCFNTLLILPESIDSIF